MHRIVLGSLVAILLVGCDQPEQQATTKKTYESFSTPCHDGIQAIGVGTVACKDAALKNLVFKVAGSPTQQ